MKGKASKTRGDRQRKAVKDLPVAKSKAVKGGDKVSFNEFKIVKTVDKASPAF